ASPRRCFHRARLRDSQCARARHHRFRARDPTRPRRSPAVAPVRRTPSPRDRPSGPRPGDRRASIPSRRRRHAPRAAAPLPLAPATPRDKRQTLIDLLDDEPTLIFTGAIATARDVAGTLRCAIMTSRGAQPRNAIEAFRRGSIDRLVATDLAAEGLNLQRAAV